MMSWMLPTARTMPALISIWLIIYKYAALIYMVIATDSPWSCPGKAAKCRYRIKVDKKRGENEFYKKIINHYQLQ